MKKLGFSILGVGCLIIGITLVLAWWPEVVHFLKGVGGMSLAVTGLTILAMIRD